MEKAVRLPLNSTSVDLIVKEVANGIWKASREKGDPRGETGEEALPADVVHERGEHSTGVGGEVCGRGAKHSAGE